LEEEYARICRVGTDRLNASLDAQIAAAEPQSLDEQVLQKRLESEVPEFFDAEFKSAVRLYDQRVSESLRSHERRSDGLIESIRKTAAGLFDIPYRPMDGSPMLEKLREPYWVAYHWEQRLGPAAASVIDELTPSGLRRRRMARRFRDKVETVVLYNAGKLREKVYGQIDGAFGRFGRSLDERLAATIAATLGAARAAMDKRRSHAGAIAADVERLNSMIANLEDIGGRLNRCPGRHGEDTKNPL
jgi:hypothetical protein